MHSLRSSFQLVVILLIVLSMLSSCNQDQFYSMENSQEIEKMQKKIVKLAKACQVDSISIRSTDRKSVVSSIYILINDDKNESEYKTSIEFLPYHKLTLDEKSKEKKEALHQYKPNITKLNSHIEKAKNSLPNGYTYKDVQSINYAASVVGERYYLSLEVSKATEEKENEYVKIFYSSQERKDYTKDTNLEPKDVGDIKYVVSFRIENDTLEMLKTSN